MNKIITLLIILTLILPYWSCDHPKEKGLKTIKTHPEDNENRKSYLLKSKIGYNNFKHTVKHRISTIHENLTSEELDILAQLFIDNSINQYGKALKPKPGMFKLLLKCKDLSGAETIKILKDFIK